jgi:hypothetical protein
MKKSLVVLSVLALILLVGSASAADTWEYSPPSFMIPDLEHSEITDMVCGHVPYSATASTLGIFVSINVTHIDWTPLPLPIETYALVNFTAPNGTVTQYDFRETNWYWGTGLSPVDLESSVHYQVGTYDIVAGLGTCQLVVDHEIEPMHVESTEYGDGWQIKHYSDGKSAYSNHATYLRWDNQWIPEEWLNISNGNWSYAVADAGTKMNFTADGRTISIPKANTKFDLSLFKISPSLTYTKTALLNNMVSVNATVGYLTFPYSLSQIKDYADEHNIKVGRWLFQAGQEHIEIYDDVKINHTYVNMTGQNETVLAVTTLDKSFYQFKIVNDEIRLYFLKAEANKMSGNITFEMNSWTVGNGGNAWTGNSTKDNTTLNRDTNHIMLRQEVDDYISYWRCDGAWTYDVNTSYDENTTSDNTGTLSNGAYFMTSKLFSPIYIGHHGNATFFNFSDGPPDLVNVGNAANINPTNAITVEAWIYPNILVNWQRIVERKYSYVLGISSYHGVYFGLTKSSQTYIDGTTPLVVNQWRHVVGRWNGTTMNIYINGIKQIETATISAPISTNNNSVLFGYLDESPYYHYGGLIDDVRIYSRALTNDEINQTMSNTMKSSGKLTTWFNAGTGNYTYQVTINASTDATSNYTVWYGDNSTGSYTQLGGTLTGDNTLAISGTKYQNTDVQVRLAGNTTSTPEIVTITFWTEAIPDTSFTVTLPTGQTQAFFNATNKSSKNVNATGQNLTAGFLYITNTGNVALDFYAVQDSAQPTGVVLKGSTDNNPAGESVVPIADSLTKIIDAVPVSGTQYFWLWADYSNALPMNAQRNLSVNSSQ